MYYYYSVQSQWISWSDDSITSYQKFWFHNWCYDDYLQSHWRLHDYKIVAGCISLIVLLTNSFGITLDIALERTDDIIIKILNFTQLKLPKTLVNVLFVLYYFSIFSQVLPFSMSARILKKIF